MDERLSQVEGSDRCALEKALVWGGKGRGRWEKCLETQAESLPILPCLYHYLPYLPYLECSVTMMSTEDEENPYSHSRGS